MSGLRDDDYKALREAGAWLDLPGRGKIVVRGEDRARLLHALTTNQIADLQPGGGCYAFFLNAQGRILGDVHVFCMPDHFLLDTEPETRQKLYAHLERFIIADDVTLEDVTDQTATLALDGPNAARILTGAGAPAPEAPYSHLPWGTVSVARVSCTGGGGFLLFVPAAEKDKLVRRLESAGARASGLGAARTVRLENGRPRYGEDFSEANLPHETQLLHGLHFNKGCYLGQEIVERVRSRGHVNRLLVRLGIDGSEPPASGAKVLADGKEIGEITSAALSPALGKVVALAYLRAEYAGGGNTLSVEGTRAEV